ncbi:hypothetical protein BGX27_002432, partial [Mortierella sp. AM989]
FASTSCQCITFSTLAIYKYVGSLVQLECGLVVGYHYAQIATNALGLLTSDEALFIAFLHIGAHSSVNENPDHIAWATKKFTFEHVSIVSFAIEFKFYHRLTAEKQYEALISNPKISLARRQRLSATFESFNANRAPGFWTKRRTLMKADVISMRAAADAMEVGHRRSKGVYNELFQNEKQAKMHKEMRSAIDISDGRQPDVQDTSSNPFVDEGDISTPLTWTPSSRSTGQRSSRKQLILDNQSSESAREESKYAGSEEDLDSGGVINGNNDTNDKVDVEADSCKQRLPIAHDYREEEGSANLNKAANRDDAATDKNAQLGSNTNADSDNEDDDNDDAEELLEIEQAIASGQSPFLPLLKYIYEKVKGSDVKLPQAPSTFICEEYKELYHYAYNKLLRIEQQDSNKNDKGKSKKSKTFPYHVDKDVLGALSGIVNTISPSSQVLTFTPAIKDEMLMPVLDEKDSDITDLLADLLESYCPGHKDDPLAPMSFESLRLAPPTTEHVIVSVWSFILAVLLGGAVVRGIPGELASQAAREVRLYVEKKYGVTNNNGKKAKICGRKVDISLRVYANGHWNNEICMFEFKDGTASDLICLNQQLKAVRINTAILHHLEYKGVDVCEHFPLIAEGRGLFLSIYALKRIGNVIAAGKSTETVAWIPSDLIQLKQFLKSSSMQLLLKLADHTTRYAVHVQETLSTITRPPLPSTPPRQFETPFVAFTPHKQNKRKHVEFAEYDEDYEEDHREEEDEDNNAQ